ncbi:hypothetical protein [Streptomyces sp. NPDC059850]|uniref:hypothetical protein n=1 Tax=Streptomyces sp. NPDC059850 TaxID=3346970 RepID=UPI003656BB26
MTSVRWNTWPLAGDLGLVKVMGKTSWVLSIAAVVLLIGPWLLPSTIPQRIRFFPFPFFAPMAIAAVVSGVNALRDMRGSERGNRCWAWAGITLGSVTILVPSIVIVWACWDLTRAGV